MNNRHYHLIDILKIMTLMAIAILHVNEFVFYTDIFPLGSTSPFWYMWSFYARVFTLGGQILVAIIFFLFGLSLKKKKSLLLIALFALLGQAVLAMVFRTFEWDIYAYLAVTSVLIAGIPFLYQKNRLVLIVSFIMLLIPTHFFQNMTGENELAVILTGKMSESNTGSWPILPWFFLSTLFYQLGLYFRDNESVKTFHPREKWIWPMLAIYSVPFFGAYYWVPIGPHFYQFVFNQWPHIFWANFLVFVFIMRLAFIESVRVKLAENKFAQWISGLYWVRHMGLVYLLSIIYLGIGMQFSETFRMYPKSFDLFFAALMPICELSGRFLVFVVKYLKNERIS